MCTNTNTKANSDMKREDFIFARSYSTIIYDKDGQYLGEIAGILPSDIDDMSNEELESLLKDNGIKTY